MTRAIVRTPLALVLAAVTLAACSTVPVQREAIEQTWAERDQERARECAQRGLRYIGGTCVCSGA